MNQDKLHELTNPQKSIWLMEQMYTNTNISNIAGYAKINEEIDEELLREAIYTYVKKNDSIRTRISIGEENPKQYISEFERFEIEVGTCDEEDMVKISEQFSKKRFNLIDSRLFDFKIYKFTNNKAAIAARFHHMITDAWATTIYFSEVFSIYAKLKEKEVIDANKYNSYIEYLGQEKKYFESEKYTKDKVYWEEMLKKDLTPTNIKNNVAKSNGTIARRKPYYLGEEVLGKLNEFCQKNNTSLYTLFTSVIGVYLSKINETDNVAIGTTVLNRKNAQEKNTFGMYINTLPYVIETNNEMAFKELISSRNSAQKTFFRHQRFPYTQIQKMLKDDYNIVDSIFNVAVSYQNAKNKFEDVGVSYETVWQFTGQIINTLDIHFFDINNTGVLNIFYDYQIDKLDENDIQNIHSRIMYIIDQVIGNEEILIKDIDIITPKDKRLIEDVFNNTKNNYPKEKSIHELISNAAKEHPENIAIVHKQEKITYKQLEERTNAIANNLLIKGIKTGDVVSILFREKDINLICSMIGIIKAGGSFLALYSEYPEDRISYILENSNTKMLITEECYREKYEVEKLLISDIKDCGNCGLPHVKSDEICYIIYTSGSTGKPKGIQIAHQNLVNFVYGLNKNFEQTISHIDKFMCVANISFDASMQEIFTPLVFGATLHLYKDLNASSDIELAEYVLENEMTFSFFPPSMLDTICQAFSNSKKKVALNKLSIGVEPIKAQTLSNYMELNPNMKILNGYGPSEATICCAMYLFKNDLEMTDITPIGRPMANSKIHLLNASKQEVPVGESGEIYVEGDCVGKGYLNNIELTKEVFDVEKKIYKTGDFAKLLPTGDLLFIGRKDNQIKYRGYRIDLGEIEQVLINMNEIQNCFVCMDTQNEITQLLAFVTAENKNLTQLELRTLLAEKLPHYMIPNDIIFVDAFPLTANGKIDKTVLVKEFTNNHDAKYVEPTTENEKVLCEIWAKILKIEKVGITDNFFNIGGDSLIAIKIAIQSSHKGYKLTAQDFYKYPTVEAMIKSIDDKELNNEKCNYLRKVKLEKTSKTELAKDILLLGATGFLGSQMISDIIENTNSNVYCLVRGINKKVAEERLKERLQFYFGDKLNKYYGDRIVILNGEGSLKNLGLDNDTYDKLISKELTIINSAAIVKHVGKEEEFVSVNVGIIKNLIKMCEQNQSINLVHISTMSVGSSVDINNDIKTYSENDLYINQDIDANVYIRSKFEAEQLLAKAVSSGCNISIFRMGNITWRNVNGVFQINSSDNLFFNILKLAKDLQMFPSELKNVKMNISPVDECSNMVVNILQKNNKLNVYHIYNFNELTFEEIIEKLNQSGENVEFVSYIEFMNALENRKKANGMDSYVLSQFSGNHGDKEPVKIQNIDTVKILKEIDLKWNNVENKYFKGILGGKDE